MRAGQNPRRVRSRNGIARPNLPSRGQTFDSSSQDGRIRGSARQVYEKYLMLARDSNAVGDRVASENFSQHAEHYFRLLSQSGENGHSSSVSGESGSLADSSFSNTGEANGRTGSSRDRRNPPGPGSSQLR